LAARLSPSWSLLLCARDEQRLGSVATSVGARARRTDVTRLEEIDDALADAKSAFGRVDAVVLAVGSIVLKPAHSTSDGDWDETMALNARSAFGVVRGVARLLRPGPCSVVLFSSAAARVGLPNHEAISAAKGAIEALARSAAATYASQGLRFNVIAPGLVRTPLAARLTQSPPALAASTAMHPLGRIGEASEVASLAEWLVGPVATWVTGQVFSTDGGLSTLRRS
jgi:NAD(P)-dependent dehydrogenase (short-subunit alcohol dehydrogenase family)